MQSESTADNALRAEIKRKGDRYYHKVVSQASEF